MYELEDGKSVGSVAAVLFHDPPQVCQGVKGLVGVLLSKDAKQQGVDVGTGQVMNVLER
jgi:hypothetical protein